MTNYEQKQKRKSIYIPQVAQGLITNSYAAEKIGISVRSVCILKKRWREHGSKIFIRADRGHRAYNLKYNRDYINNLLRLYKNWDKCPYHTFWTGLRDIEKVNIPYGSLCYILRKEGIKPYREYSKKEKPIHESRKERKSEGELVQMDASKHDWFMNGTYTTLHGGIDDATHKITGLYFCDNECRLGYNEVLRQTFKKYGVMRSVYIDRHSSFVNTPKNKKLTLEEKIYKEKTTTTHFTDICDELNIEVILALSAQGKGRIERLWQTLQGILPFYFRRLGIEDNQSANTFLHSFIERFNAEFSVAPASLIPSWKRTYKDLDYLLSIKTRHKTDQWGVFIFHDHYFELLAPHKACIHFTLCISEQFGLKGFYHGKYYDVVLCEDCVSNVSGGHMPQVEQDLINRYLLNDLRAKIV